MAVIVEISSINFPNDEVNYPARENVMINLTDQPLTVSRLTEVIDKETGRTDWTSVVAVICHD